MTTATKKTMKTDAEKAALKEQLIEALDISASESEKIVNGLYDKYGNQAKKITQDCLRRPYEIRDALGMKGRCTSRSMLNYFNDEKRSADVVNKALAPKDNTISTNDRKKTKTAMQQDATAAQKATAQVKENKKSKEVKNTQGGKIATQKANSINTAVADNTTTSTRKNAKAAEDSKKAKTAEEKKKAQEAAARKAKTAESVKKDKAEAARKERAIEEDKKAAAQRLETWQKNLVQNSGDMLAKMKDEVAKNNEEMREWSMPYALRNNQARSAASGNTQTASKTKANNTGSTTTAKKQETKSATTQTTTNTTTRSNTGTYDWANHKTQTYQPQPIHQEAKVLTPEEKLAQAKGSKGYITFDDLKKDGIEVTATDLQTVINKQHSLNGKAKVLNSITPGKRAKDLADYMTRNTSGRPQGGCLGGVQTGMAAVYGSDAESPLNGQSSDWNEYKDHRWESNSACDAHNLLDKSGDWVTVDIRNSAYHNPSNNIEMQNFNNKLRSGTIASTDNRAIEGSRGYENSTASAKHGHIWVRDNKGRNCSDGIQLENGIDFSRYGKEMHISISTDSRIPDDLALQLIAEAEKRRSQYTILQENVYTAKVR